jgi:hypothetical protein
MSYTFWYPSASLGRLLKKDVNEEWQMIRSHSVEGEASRIDERYLCSLICLWKYFNEYLYCSFLKELFE